MSAASSDSTGKRSGPFNRLWLAVGGVLLVVVLVLVLPVLRADENTSDTVPRPTTTLADCPAEPAPAPAEWPLVLPDQVVVTAYDIDGNTFTATGITNDVERVLVASMEDTLGAYDVDEPDGGASDVVVGFRSAVADGVVVLSDEDDDSCWDAVYELTFATEPDPDDLQPTDPDADELAGPDPDEASGLVEPVGGGTITTARGAFPLTITACALDPVAVEATAENGTLAISGDPSGAVVLTWTYDDGVVVSDDAARAVVASPTSALFIGDGTTAEGPESILAEVDCFS
ncbi:MAG: hypothetical protein AAGA93_09150 [Actinomycetota bacterium]